MWNNEISALSVGVLMFLFPIYCDEQAVKNITAGCVSFRSSSSRVEENKVTNIKVHQRVKTTGKFNIDKKNW